jgi:DNA primase
MESSVKQTTIRELRADIPISLVFRTVGGKFLTHYWMVGWENVYCPFHVDKIASGSINKALGLYKCHACEAPREDGKAGDIIDLAKLYLKTSDTKEAMTWLKETFLEKS